MTSRPLTFLAPEADTDTVIAHLDAHPHWNKDTTHSRGHVAYTHNHHVVGYGQQLRVLLLLPSRLSHSLNPTSGLLFEAIHTINAVELDLPHSTDSEPLTRLMAIATHHQPNGPNSLLCRCGDPTPCQMLRLATGQDTTP